MAFDGLLYLGDDCWFFFGDVTSFGNVYAISHLSPDRRCHEFEPRFCPVLEIRIARKHFAAYQSLQAHLLEESPDRACQLYRSAVLSIPADRAIASEAEEKCRVHYLRVLRPSTRLERLGRYALDVSFSMPFNDNCSPYRAVKPHKGTKTVTRSEQQ